MLNERAAGVADGELSDSTVDECEVRRNVAAVDVHNDRDGETAQSAACLGALKRFVGQGVGDTRARATAWYGAPPCGMEGTSAAEWARHARYRRKAGVRVAVNGNRAWTVHDQRRGRDARA